MLTFFFYCILGFLGISAPQVALEDEYYRRCISYISGKALNVLREDTSKLLRMVQQPEPVWKESLLPHHLQLPHASQFMGDNPLGKLYLDEPTYQSVSSAAEDTFKSRETVDEPLERGEPELLMENSEKKAWQSFGKRLNSGGRHLGWGSGPGRGNAQFACALHYRVHSIDSVQQWCPQTEKHFASGTKQICGKVMANCIENVGVLDEYGMLTHKGAPYEEYGVKYIAAIDEFKNVSYYDSIMVDGRFRVGCALKALKYLRRDSVLMIHDFNAARRNYESVFNYYDKLYVEGSLVFLAPKANVSERHSGAYSLYLKDPL